MGGCWGGRLVGGEEEGGVEADGEMVLKVLHGGVAALREPLEVVVAGGVAHRCKWGEAYADGAGLP